MTNQENDQGSAAKKMEGFLRTVISLSGLELSSDIVACNGHVQPNTGSPAGELVPALPIPELQVEFTGPDVPLLLTHNAELLHAIEHVAARVLRLETEDNDRIRFDADGYKAGRDRNLRDSAESAIRRVRTSGQPFAFPTMSSRERRMLHLLLSGSGLQTASSGEGPRRFVVLYPEGFTPTETPQKPASSPTDRTRAIRERFRPR